MKTRLLVIGDGVVPTGYARVVHGILRNLPQDEYEIHHLAVNYYGDPHRENWTIYPAFLGGDVQGVGRIASLAEQIKPAIILAVNDLWIQEEYLQVLAQYDRRCKLIAYSPVDAAWVDPEWLGDFSSLSRVVMFTEFGRREVKRALPDDCMTPIDVIPLGVETEEFFPCGKNGTKPFDLVNTLDAKRELGLFGNGELEDSFLVLNGNRNQPRKRIDITIKGFSLFARGKPKNVQLYLHMGTEDQGWNVLKLAKRYGVDDRLVITGNDNAIPGIPTKCLNTLYNASDVGLNTSTGEGWGLSNFEHAAAGKAQVVPRVGALAEIWDGCAEFVEPAQDLVYEGILTEGKLVDPEGVAAALEALYTNREHRSEVAARCYQRATRLENQWKNIGLRWHQLFQKLLSGERQGKGGEVHNKKAELLLKVLEVAPPGLVVEVGSLREPAEVSTDGFSTFYLAKRSEELGREFRSFDLNPYAVEVSNRVLKERGLKAKVEFGNGKEVLSELGPIAFLYLDSSDDPKDTLEQYIAAELRPGAVVVVDDAQAYRGQAYGKSTHLGVATSQRCLTQGQQRLYSEFC